jgi:hypothetical protein
VAISLPVILKGAARSQNWIFDYRLDWQARVPISKAA